MQRVDQTGSGDDRRSMLIVMKNRNIHLLTQLLFDDETFWRLDVLQVDSAKRRPHNRYGIDEGVGIRRVQFQVNAVNIGKFLEQDGLALHHRF